MNIFITSTCPIKSAEFLDDKRVVKMCLESAQMLSTAIREHGGQATYKTTHVNHPSNVWTRQTRENYMWLYRHFVALCLEYELRYNKEHKCFRLSKELLEGAQLIPEGELEPFANCAANKELGLDFKHYGDITLAYRDYLEKRWLNDKREPKWYGKSRVNVY